MSDIVWAKGDNWEAIYVDGILVLQDHRIHVDDVLVLVMGIQPITSFKKKYVDLDWMENMGYLPNNIDEVKWEN